MAAASAATETSVQRSAISLADPAALSLADPNVARISLADPTAISLADPDTISLSERDLIARSMTGKALRSRWAPVAGRECRWPRSSPHESDHATTAKYQRDPFGMFSKITSRKAVATTR